MASILPNHTIYLQNLNDKIKKPDLKRHLYSLFCQYGRIVDIFVAKTPMMRGQAFVTFQELSSANVSLRSLQGYPFFGKPMKIQYAKRKSRVFASDRATTETMSTNTPHLENEMETEESEETPFAMTPHASSLSGDLTLVASTTATVDDNASMEGSCENRILFLDHLPLDTTEGVLVLIFQSCPGYKEIRLIPAQQDRKAFVEFATLEQATSAMSILNGYRISSTHQLNISYAKK